MRIGHIKPCISQHLLVYTNVFQAEVKDGVTIKVILSDELSNVKERTAAVNSVLKDLQSKDLFQCLKGWRNEVSAFVRGKRV